jgi:hypothetical protein
MRMWFRRASGVMAFQAGAGTRLVFAARRSRLLARGIAILRR